MASSSFLKGYEELVMWIRADKSDQMKHEDLSKAELGEFLGEFRTAKLENQHELDLSAENYLRPIRRIQENRAT